MNGFLYFIEGKNTVTKADLEAAGLAYAFDGPFSFREAGTGPGAAGVVVGVGENIGFYPDRQTWLPIPGSPGVFLGFEIAETKPKPADLARTEQIDGYVVELADGESWLVPVARCFPEGSMLPMAMTIGPDGKVVKEALPKFAAACRDAERLWDFFRSENGMLNEDETVEPLDDSEMFALAAGVLALNYRVGPAEVSALRLLTTKNIKRILWCFVDAPGYLAVQTARADADAEAKKNDADTPDGEDSHSGLPDG